MKGEDMDKMLNQPNRDMRQFRRKTYAETIDFSVMMPEMWERTTSRLTGRIVDLSDGGVGIQADYPLEPGVMLSFVSGDSTKQGVIKWVSKGDDQPLKAGLAFRTDDTYGMQYPVELSDTCSEIREDIEDYAGALE